MRCSRPRNVRDRVVKHYRSSVRALLLSFRVQSSLTAADASAATLLGFAPLQRMRLKKLGNLGLAWPDTFRLQGFAPSCRLASSAAFRPCFMPGALLGFPFRAFSPRGAFVPLGLGNLRDVGIRSGGLRVASTPATAESPAFKALLSTRIRTSRGPGMSRAVRPLPSWVWSL